MCPDPERHTNETPYQLEIFPSGNPPPPDILALYAQQNAELRLREIPYSDQWREHIEKSRQMIQNTTAGQRGKALILGLGNGIGIPLAEMAEQFDTVTIVDIDEAAAQSTVARLPRNKQEKFQIIIADMTGVIADYAAVIRQPVSFANTSELLKAATDAAASLYPHAPSVGEVYSHVTSSVVMSQLGSMLHRLTEREAQRRFGIERLNPLQHGEDFFLAMTALSKQLTADHLNMISAAVLPSGRAYLSDTVTVRHIARNPGNQEVYAHSALQPMIDQAWLHQQLNKHFTVDAHTNWSWYRHPPDRATTEPTFGSAYGVGAYALSPGK